MIQSAGARLLAFDQISDIVGKDNFIQNEEILSFYSTDVFVSSKEKPLAVVRPNDSYELIKIVVTERAFELVKSC